MTSWSVFLACIHGNRHQRTAFKSCRIIPGRQPGIILHDLKAVITLTETLNHYLVGIIVSLTSEGESCMLHNHPEVCA